MKKSTNNKDHPKLSKAEEKAKQHLISVGLYGRSVSIISNAFRLTSVIRNFSEKYLFKEFNLSFSGFTVMWVMWVWGDLETAKLAKNAGIAKSTLTGILKTLEKHGYCQRIPHSDDARKVVVHITSAGEKLMEKLFPKFHEIEDLAVSELTDEEFETTIDSFRTMLNTMENFTNNDQSK
jgi:DNA-binding MarR family transcriptional regulator